MLLELLQRQAFSTPTDFLFLNHRIFMYLKGLYFLPSNKSTPENYQLILATASYCISVLGNWHVKAGGNEMEMKPAQILALVLRFAVSEFAGISEREEMVQKEDREWVYYMWLTSAFIRAVCSDDEADRRSLGIMCNRIEKYMNDMDRVYLEAKIKECREWMAERKI